MGSPSFDIRVGERLRPWILSGLTHVFRQPDQNQDDGPQTSGQQGYDVGQHASFLPPWDAYFQKAHVGASVVFTYVELGKDLSGSADKSRGSMFRKLLGYLGWAGKGVHSFWPVAAWSDSNLTPDRVVFWQGIQAIGASHVVCFGKQCAQIVTGFEQIDVHQLKYHDFMIHILPSPDDLCSMLPHEFHLSTDMLKSIKTP